MPPLVEPQYSGDVIAYELNQDYNRVEGTIVASQTLVVGSVLQNSSGDFTRCTTGASANGICLSRVTTGAGQTAKALVLNRGPAIVLEDQMDWGTLNESGVTAAKTALLNLGIKVVKTVHA